MPPNDFSKAKLPWENILEILHFLIIRFMDDTIRCDLRSMVQICTVAWYQKPWLLCYSNSFFLFDLTSMVFMKSPSLQGNRERKRRTVWRKSGAPRSLKWEQERRSVSMLSYLTGFQMYRYCSLCRIPRVLRQHTTGPSCSKAD